MYARLLMCAVREGNIEYNYGPQTFLHICYTTIQSGIRNTMKHKKGDYERQQGARAKGILLTCHPVIEIMKWATNDSLSV